LGLRKVKKEGVAVIKLRVTVIGPHCWGPIRNIANRDFSELCHLISLQIGTNMMETNNPEVEWVGSENEKRKTRFCDRTGCRIPDVE